MKCKSKGLSSKFTGNLPQNMQELSIVKLQQSKSLYETDDVLQLQCIGEVESINAMPSKVDV